MDYIELRKKFDKVSEKAFEDLFLYGESAVKITGDGDVIRLNPLDADDVCQYTFYTKTTE